MCVCVCVCDEVGVYLCVSVSVFCLPVQNVSEGQPTCSRVGSCVLMFVCVVMYLYVCLCVRLFVSMSVLGAWEGGSVHVCLGVRVVGVCV